MLFVDVMSVIGVSEMFMLRMGYAMLRGERCLLPTILTYI